MIKVLIPKHASGAGKWIYQGFYEAWKVLGYEPIWYQDNQPLPQKNCYLMCVNSSIIQESFKRFDKIFLYCLPSQMPKHWGSHPNFVCHLEDNKIKVINSLENVVKFSFGNVPNEFLDFGNVNCIPLAFDDISYQVFKEEKIYDVCFVGGWANNGFNEKAPRLKNFLGAFSNSNLKCGFYINRNLSPEKENKLLCSTKFPLNIHDQYQIELGWDTNERTFKSLGLAGSLVSDRVLCLTSSFFEKLRIDLVDSPKEMITKIQELIQGYKKENIDVIKEIRKNHTYKSRITQLLEG